MRVVQFKVMQNLKLRAVFFLFITVILAGATASAETLVSPGGNIELSFGIKDPGGWKSCPVYEVTWIGKPVIADTIMREIVILKLLIDIGRKQPKKYEGYGKESDSFRNSFPGMFNQFFSID